MNHSLTFGDRNTWKDWHLMPETRPVINPPGAKTEYVNIPGMDGALDFTEALAGIKYENRVGSWKFWVMNDYGKPNYEYSYWYELYSSILEYIHGRRLLIWSEDDPEYCYYGRLSMNEWASEKDWSKITIDYIIEPYKYRAKVDDDGRVTRDVTKSTSAVDWLWDDLYNLTILYGKFDVNGSKWRNFIYNPTESDAPSTIEIAVTCSSEMIVQNESGNIVARLQAGRNRDSGIRISTGYNIFQFIGNGTVTIDYDKDGVIL